MADLFVDFQSYFNMQLLHDGVLHMDNLPQEGDNALALYEYEGVGSLSQIGSSTRSLQLVVRHKSARAARTKAWELYRSLQSDDGIVYLTTTRWTLIHLRQPPFKLKVDEAGRSYYCFNLSITTEND
jgi:hypothetical protein